jgi:hypothetical protein
MDSEVKQSTCQNCENEITHVKKNDPSYISASNSKLERKVTEWTLLKDKILFFSELVILVYIFGAIIFFSTSIFDSKIVVSVIVGLLVRTLRNTQTKNKPKLDSTVVVLLPINEGSHKQLSD